MLLLMISILIAMSSWSKIVRVIMWRIESNVGICVLEKLSKKYMLKEIHLNLSSRTQIISI